MTDMRRYAVLIIGGGQAGPSLAHDLAKRGQRVALAERKDLGGSCVNFGCTPTKAAIASARVAHDARRAAEFGLTIPAVTVDFAAVLDRARRMLMDMRHGLDRSFEGTDNPMLLRGHARLDGRERDLFRVVINGIVLFASQVVLDTGTRSSIPAIPGLDQVDFIHAGNWLDKPALPSHLAILGGGYVGLEMSQLYRRLGSRVTVIERATRIAEHEDEDVALALQKILEGEGITFRLGSSIERVDHGRPGVRIVIDDGDKRSELEVSDIFVATGRTPNTDDLGLETIGVKLSAGGIVETDRRLATNVPGVWAAGDIRGGPMFTHTAWDDYRILLSQIAGDGSRTLDRIVPYAVFTDPELGRVGMTEAEARRSGRNIKIGRFDIKRNSKARELGDDDGFIKVVIDAKTDRILGAAVLAINGAELVHMYVDVMNADAPYTVIRDAIHVHPTLAETIQSAVSAVD